MEPSPRTRCTSSSATIAPVSIVRVRWPSPGAVACAVGAVAGVLLVALRRADCVVGAAKDFFHLAIGKVTLPDGASAMITPAGICSRTAWRARAARDSVNCRVSCAQLIVLRL